MALAAVVSLARADAPTDQYQFFFSGTLSIYDNYTKLRWERAPSTLKYSFQDAATHCQTLSLDTYVDWRVPSYKEILTLVDEHPHVEYENGGLVPHAIDPNAFPGTLVDQPYWTSSMYPDPSQNYAYAVTFRDGEALQTQISTQLYVRCVR
jgi:hypothetical protein